MTVSRKMSTSLTNIKSASFKKHIKKRPTLKRWHTIHEGPKSDIFETETRCDMEDGASAEQL